MAQAPKAPRITRINPSEPEEPANEESGFETSFAPPPPDVVITGESQTRPATVYTPQVTTATEPESQVTITTNVQSSSKIKAIKLLGPVGAYPVGSVVPANMFDDVQRLINLGVAEYTEAQAITSQPDPDMLTAMRLAQPLSIHRSGIAQAPWVQSSVYDIIGPAVARANQPTPQVLTAPEGYKAIAGEFGQTLIVADQINGPKEQVTSPTDTEE